MTLLTLLSSLPTPVPDPGTDFWTTCFEVPLRAALDTDVTVPRGTLYNIPDGLAAEDVLVFISSSRATGRGRPVGGGNQSPVDITCWLATPATGDIGVDAVRVRRISAGTATTVTISIVCVVNPASDSRFWVRRSGNAQLPGGVLTLTDPVATDPITDTNKVAVFITGQQTSQTARNAAHEGKFTADWNGTAAELTRGKGTLLGRVSWAVVEFGDDWADVQRLEFTSSDVGSAVWVAAPGDPTAVNTPAITTLGGSALTDISRCFLEAQFRNSVSSAQGNDEQGEAVSVTGVDEFSVWKSVHGTPPTPALPDPTKRHHVVWIVEWDGPATATAPIAEHVAALVTTAVEPSEEGTVTRTITEVASTATASVMGPSASSDGTGAGTPRGHVDFCLTSTTTVDETRSETGRSERRAYTVFQWPAGIQPTLLGIGAVRAGVAGIGAVRVGVSVLSARAGSARVGAVNAGEAGLGARGGAAGLGGVEGGAT